MSNSHLNPTVDQLSQAESLDPLTTDELVIECLFEPDVTFEIELSGDLCRSLREYLDSHDEDFNQFMANAIQHFLDQHKDSQDKL